MLIGKDWAKFWGQQRDGLHHSMDVAYYARLAAELKLILPDTSTRSVLELGCGAGELFAHLGFNKALSYKGVDISPSMLTEFSQRYDAVDLSAGAAESYRIETKFDIIFLNAVMQYLDRRQVTQLFTNTSAMLASRGFIVIAMIPWASLKKEYHAGDILPPTVPFLSRVKRVLKTSVQDPMGYWYSWNDLRAWAEKFGLCPFFHGSLSDPYRFHVVLVRLEDFDDSHDPFMTQLLAGRRS